MGRAEAVHFQLEPQGGDTARTSSCLTTCSPPDLRGSLMSKPEKPVVAPDPAAGALTTASVICH